MAAPNFAASVQLQRAAAAAELKVAKLRGELNLLAHSSTALFSEKGA